MAKGRALVTIALGAAMLLASVSTAGAAFSTKKHKLPKEVCPLVTDEQVAPLVVDAVAEEATPSPQEVGCYWQDGKDIPTSLATLNVQVTKFPGIPLGQLKLSLNAEAHDPGSERIKGLGTIAFQRSVIPPNTEVQALIGKLLLDVEFSGSGPVTDEAKAQTLAIAKAVAKHV